VLKNKRDNTDTNNDYNNGKKFSTCTSRMMPVSRFPLIIIQGFWRKKFLQTEHLYITQPTVSKHLPLDLNQRSDVQLSFMSA